MLLDLEWTASSELGPRDMLESNSSFTEHLLQPGSGLGISEPCCNL